MEKWSYENNAPWALVKASLVNSSVFTCTIFIIGLMDLFRGKGADFFFMSLVVCFLTITLTFFVNFAINYLYYFLFKDWLLENKLEYSVVIGILIMYFNYFLVYMLISGLLDKNRIIPPVPLVIMFSGYLLGVCLGLLSFHYALYKKVNLNYSGKDFLKNILKDKEKFF